jgi:feruloyl-CoA synthase
VEESNAAKGFIFDGRLSEDFKLATGTWVSVGPLKARYLAGCAPLAKEFVVSGHDRDDLTALVFPDLDACRALAVDLGSDATPATILAHPDVRAAFASRLTELAQSSTGSSTRIDRVILLEESPSADRGEITDKGSINQRAVLARHANLVTELYDAPSPRVIGIFCVSSGIDLRSRKRGLQD